ncbi:PLDc N-terminal domain-containing protein [Mycoplasmatota bacterium]|nr:PLDc N-terminal domain-containing protein [Mycoplasmatota bacterium]
MDIIEIILLLSPIIIINYVMVIYCIIDVLKEERTVKGGKKIIWILLIALLNPFGWLLYLLIGREE